MKTYNILIKARVENANAFQGYYIGVPTPITAISFAEFIKLELLREFKKNEYLDSLKNYDPLTPYNSFDFATIHQIAFGFEALRYKLNKGHERYANYTKSAKTDSINAPTVDMRKFSSDFFISFKLELKQDLEYVEEKYIKIILINILKRSGFSGGKIFEVFENNILILDDTDLHNEFESFDKMLSKKLKFKEQIWFLIENFTNNSFNAFLEDVPEFKNLSSFDQFIHVIKKKNDKDSSIEYHKILDGYYIPNIKGYKFLQSIQEPNNICKYNNVFAEPILGVVRARSLDSYLKNPKECEIFWSLEQKENYIIAKAK